MPSILDSSSPAKNLAINGNFDFWQRGTSVTSGNLNQSGYTTADRWRTDYSFGSTNPSISWARSASVPTLAQSGFQSTYSYQISSTVAKTFAATDYFQPFNYRMEGLDAAKLIGKNATISFWFQSSVTGTYSLCVQNQSAGKQYVTTFTISAANTWQQISSVIPIDATSTWAVDNSASLVVEVAALAGSTYSTSTLNSWGSLSGVAASTATNYLSSTSLVMKIAQFQILDAPVLAPVFQRAGLTIQQEQSFCFRYFEASNGDGSTQTSHCYGVANAYSAGAFHFKVLKRANPTCTFGYNSLGDGLANWDSVGSANATVASSSNGASTSALYLQKTSGGPGYVPGFISAKWTADAEL